MKARNYRWKVGPETPWIRGFEVAHVIPEDDSKALCGTRQSWKEEQNGKVNRHCRICGLLLFQDRLTNGPLE